jgi:hypothetical protein
LKFGTAFWLRKKNLFRRQKFWKKWFLFIKNIYFSQIYWNIFNTWLNILIKNSKSYRVLNSKILIIEVFVHFLIVKKFFPHFYKSPTNFLLTENLIFKAFFSSTKCVL